MDSFISPVDWESSQSHLQINPRWPREDQELFALLAREYSQKAHVWVCSSGSSSSLQTSVKLIALSKKAFLTSAQAVNSRLQSSSEDTWALSLPLFHVGGLSILARSYLSGARVVDVRCEKTLWQADSFYQALVDEKISLSALVPTQLSDLVGAGLEAPPHLRALVIGGAALPESLFGQARALGWPVLPSFGMTEACSQIATAELGSLGRERAPMVLLDHLQARLEQGSRLAIKGESLLTGYAQLVEGVSTWTDPKTEGWLLTEDHGDLNGRVFTPLGRGSDFVQIGGETVNLLKLRSILAEELKDLDLPYEFELVALPCERRGAKLALVHTGLEEPVGLVGSFNGQVLPYEKIRESYSVGFIPRTDLQKVRAGVLIESLALVQPNQTY